MSILADRARKFGIELLPAQLDAFEVYQRELVAWNERVNLTAITAHDEIIVKHFLDSLSVAPILQSESTHSLIDIGSGAGFPGVPLKIVFPSLRVTLLEATGKKVDFLKHIITQLALSDARAIHGRAEELSRDAAYREQYDAAVARAVAELPTLVEYALPFVRVGCVFIAQKGVEVDEEMQRAERAIKELGGRLREVVPVQLPGMERRHLIVVEKVAATPDRYPRAAGAPKKKPIM
jgi:16S rRNA (guanine527-N7)-methyltransferase